MVGTSYAVFYSVMGSDRGNGGTSVSGEFTFDTSLASLHTYLGGRLSIYGFLLCYRSMVVPI